LAKGIDVPTVPRFEGAPGAIYIFSAIEPLKGYLGGPLSNSDGQVLGLNLTDTELINADSAEKLVLTVSAETLQNIVIRMIAGEIDVELAPITQITPNPTAIPIFECSYWLLTDSKGLEGFTVRFKIGNNWATESALYISGGAEEIDLTESTTTNKGSSGDGVQTNKMPPHVFLGQAQAVRGTSITGWHGETQIGSAVCE